MGRITTGVGLVSGINSKDIIDQLMSLEARPKTLLQRRIDVANQKKLAYTDLQTRLTSLKLTGTNLKKPSSFEAAKTSSSDEDVLTATASNGAAIGSFQFQVARLVTTQQSVTKGFSDADSDKVGAGTLTLEMGGGELTSQIPLSQLNGGAGVKRGLFRITDRAGKSGVIDIGSAVSLEDVIRKINTSLDVGVRASYGAQGLVLTDVTGKTLGDLMVEDIGDGTAARDLGLLGSSATGTLTGSSLMYLGRDTALDALNDGRGVRTTTSGADFTVTLNGQSWDILLGGARTLGELADTIATASGGQVKADFSARTGQLVLKDASGAGGALSVTAGANSKAALDLGLAGKSGNGNLTGDLILAGPNTVLLSSLRGGQGLNLGTISLTDRNGTTRQVDLSGARTVSDILDRINSAGTTLKASLKPSSNGIQITDASAGTGDITIADVNSTTAAELGLLGSFDTSKPAALGANLQRQWVSENMLLSAYNGGKGVSPGKFKITAANGLSAQIDLTQGNEVRLKDVIAEINSKGIGVSASLNANGDGLLITDSTGGAGKLKIVDLDGTAAKDLNILSSDATTTTIDGSFEKTLVLDANDTLKTVQQKINDLGFGMSANVMNDGSALAPYRLSLNARNSGRSGRVVFDAGATQLAAGNLVEAQDAAVFVGSAEAAQPLLITSGSNQLSNVIKGVNIELHGVSDKPVTLGVTRNVDGVVEQLNKFTDTFNEMADKIKALTKFDPETKERGVLLGESGVQQVETGIYSITSSVVIGAGRYKTLADVGVTMGAQAKLEFDEEKFRAAWGTDPEAVKGMFTMLEKGFGALIEKSVTQLTDPVNGTIPQENKTLDDQTKQFQTKMKQIDGQLETKRARLERQFAQMESVLAGLQSQQQALTSLQNLPTITSSSN